MKIKTMFRGLMMIAVAISLAQAVRAALVAEYLFDESGNVATNTGSSPVHAEMYNGATQSDTHIVAGLKNSSLDQRFVNGSTSGQVQQPSDDNNLDGFTSFTLMGWMKSETVNGGLTVVGNQRRLIWKKDALDGFGLDGGESGGSAAYLRLTVNSTPVLSGPDWGTLNNWTFFAVTFDGTSGTDNVKFYKGSATGMFNDAALVSSNTLAESIAINSPASFAVAGFHNGNIPRSFDGMMDEVRIFGATSGNSGALSLAQIQSFQQTAIPEPSIIVSLVLGGCIARGLHKRRCGRAA